MKPFQNLGLLVFVTISLVFTFPAAKGSAQTNKTILAYYEGNSSREALTAFHGDIGQLSFDTYNVDRQGNLSGSIPEDAIAFASKHKIACYLAISNWEGKDFSGPLVDEFLGNPQAEARMIETLLPVLKTHGMAGVNMDFESIPAKDRYAYGQFLKSLARQLHTAGWKLITSVPAEQSDNPSDSWTGAFDYQTIGEASDLVQLMTYDQHGPWGLPGPVAGSDWVLKSVRFASTVIAPAKLSLGLSAYGYDWDLGNKTGVQIHWNQLNELLAHTGAKPVRESGSHAMHIAYDAPDGSRHEVWYEDAESISQKAAYAVRFHLAGLNEFALGFDNQAFWDAVHHGLGSSAPLSTAP